MKGGGRSPLHRLGELVLGVFLLPGMVALATEFWLRGEDDVAHRHLGLWKTCGESTCVALSGDVTPEWLSAVRGLCVMALCLHIISVATGCCCACLGSHELNTFSFIPRVEEGSSVAAGFLMAGGLAVFARASQAHPEYRNLHFDWSFWLCFVHVCVLILCGAVIAFARDECVCRKHRCCLHGNHASSNQKRTTKRSRRAVPKGLLYYHQGKQWEQKQCGDRFRSVRVSLSESASVKLADSVKECQTRIIFYDMSGVGCADGMDRGNLTRKNSDGGEKYFNSWEGIPHLLHIIPEQKKEHSLV